MVRKEPMEQLLKRFSSLVRLSGKEDAETACDYIIRQLEKCGIAWEKYTIPVYVSNPMEAEISLAGSKFRKKALPRSFSADCPGGITAEIFYDTKAHEPMGQKQKDLWYRDCRGRIIVSDNFYEDYVQMILSYGAAGLVHAWTSDETVLHNETVCPVWGTAEPDQAAAYPDIPVVGVTKGDGAELTAFLTPGRNTQQITVRSRVEYELTEASFPVAVFPGKTEEFILVGNHFDSWHEGVTDNGTGNAAALELARLLGEAEPGRRGVRIAWWPAHSNGRYAGSAWYCDHKFQELYEHCMALINIDSPGCKGAGEVGFSSSGTVTESLKKMIFDHTGQTEVAVRALSRGSDLSFFGAQIPVQISYDYYQNGEDRGRWHCAGCGGGWWWHSVEDLYDKIDYDYLVRDTEIIWDTLNYLRNCPRLPFDAGVCMKEMKELVDDLDRSSDPAFDFAPVRQALEELENALGDTSEFPDDRTAKETGGRLGMLLCSACDPYHYDNTFSVGRLPGLQQVRGCLREETDEKEFLFLYTAFVRQRNRTVTELNKIRKEWENR